MEDFWTPVGDIHRLVRRKGTVVPGACRPLQRPNPLVQYSETHPAHFIGIHAAAVDTSTNSDEDDAAKHSHLEEVCCARPEMHAIPERELPLL